MQKKQSKVKYAKCYLFRQNNSNDRNIIKKEIDELTEKIDTITTQKNAYNRIIVKYNMFKENYKKEIEVDENIQKQI